MPDNGICELRAKIVKALANPLRLRIIDQLDTEEERCVCDLVEALGYDQPAVSKHLAILKNAGVVTSRHEGTRVLYRLRTQCVKEFLACIDRMILHDFEERQEEIRQLASSLKLKDE
ncbi:MAG: ArsR/SmtB family transcription factor [Thermacetogeniaceae bacterium]